MNKKDHKPEEDERERIDESIQREHLRDHYRDGYPETERMQAPEKWPDPPEEEKESGNA